MWLRPIERNHAANISSNVVASSLGNCLRPLEISREAAKKKKKKVVKKIMIRRIAVARRFCAVLCTKRTKISLCLIRETHGTGKRWWSINSSVSLSLSRSYSKIPLEISEPNVIFLLALVRRIENWKYGRKRREAKWVREKRKKKWNEIDSN